MVMSKDSTQSNHWETGICDCCGHSQQGSNQCGFFCTGMFCPCIGQGILQEHVGLSSGWVAPSCFYCCAAGCTSNLIPYISLFNLHQHVAHAAGIKEGCLTSLLKVICCFPCTLSQVNNQVILTKRTFEQDTTSCNCMHFLGCLGDKEFVPYEEATGLIPDGVDTQNSMDPGYDEVMQRAAMQSASTRQQRQTQRLMPILRPGLVEPDNAPQMSRPGSRRPTGNGRNLPAPRSITWKDFSPSPSPAQ